MKANKNTLTPDSLEKINAYWRAANYLSVGQIYLYDNPLLKRPLKLSDVKPLVVGHWGTTPGQNFIYVHLNRVINKYDLNMFYVAGPGHGGPAIVGNVYLEGTWSEVYPNITQDEDGLKKLFTQFSFPGGISSHVAPTTPGSIHEGGELGYSLSHAFGAAFDNPDLIVACIVGDGEAETGPLATAWQSNKFLDPITDGAVLPILHLNGYKISNPTLLARIEPDELEQFFRGCGWTPYFVEGDKPEKMHELMATVLDKAIADIRQIQKNARDKTDTTRPRWPMIVLKSPKGWTGPKEVDGLKVEGTFRSHQVPLLVDAEHPHHVKQLESWMKSYKAEELFDAKGRLMPELQELAPKGNRRMGSNPHTNGGLLLRDLLMPDFHVHAVDVPSPGAVSGQDPPARELVPGDVIRMRLGDIVPADVRLLDGDPVEVDQSALTGESLPIERKSGEAVFSGSIIRQGEIGAMVYATGANTYFGKTAQLVQAAHTVSHFQKAVLRIGNYLIILAVSLVAVIIGFAVYRGDAILTTLQFALVLTVAAIPVAMPTVLSVTTPAASTILRSDSGGGLEFFQ